jgi:DNA-cytosine methyltransferase
MITIGSCFSGIGGFELGLQRAIPNSKVIWQIEKDTFCRQVLQKHWPNTKRYNDITTINPDTLESPTILCGGFPCQDISNAGKKGGLQGAKSVLYWEMWKIIRILRPQIIIMENVSAIINRGLSDVLRSLAEIGYHAEWSCITAAQFGAPHRRERFFLIAIKNEAITNPDSQPIWEQQSQELNQQKTQSCRSCKTEHATNTNCKRCMEHQRQQKEIQQPQKQRIQCKKSEESKLSESSYCSHKDATNPNCKPKHVDNNGSSGKGSGTAAPPTSIHISDKNIKDATNPNCKRCRQDGNGNTRSIYQDRPKVLHRRQAKQRPQSEQQNYWQEFPTQPAIYRRDDGVSDWLDRNRTARVKALGNAIVPQCSEYIGRLILQSGLL